MSATKRMDTSTTLVEYHDNIIFLRLKEGADLNINSINEQHDAQKELVKNDKYGVLVDGTNNVVITKECREYMASLITPNRVATAVLTKMNMATTLIANFYIKVNKPKIPTKLFKEEKDAVSWLKMQLAAN